MRYKENLLFALRFAGFGIAIDEEEKISGLSHDIGRGTWLGLEETLHLRQRLGFLQSPTTLSLAPQLGFLNNKINHWFFFFWCVEKYFVFFFIFMFQNF